MSSLMSNSSRTAKSKTQVVFVKAKERHFLGLYPFYDKSFFSVTAGFLSVSDATSEIMSVQFCATLAH